MSTAAFAFKDKGDAHEAVNRLTERGIALEAIRRHSSPTSSETVANDTDELVTGGFVRSFLDLFEGLMHGDDLGDSAPLFDDIVRRGGEVVSVNVNSEGEQEIAEQVMEEFAPAARTQWSVGGAGVPSTAPL